MILSRRRGLGPTLFALTVSLLTLPQASLATSIAPDLSNDYQWATRIMPIAQTLELSPKGELQTDKAKWKMQKDVDGTDLLATTDGPETKAAVLRNKEGVDTISAYSLRSKGDAKSETSSALFFSKGKLSAFTACEDDGSKDSIGRICVTATKNLCEVLRKQGELNNDLLKETETYEMRALAMILTLRGPDHQLDNVVRAGNRLGLKSGLQTTRGQLFALLKQIQKEAGTKEGAKSDEKLIDTKLAANESVTSATPEPIRQPANKDAQLARKILETSLPRLKQACLATRFNQ